MALHGCTAGSSLGVHLSSKATPFNYRRHLVTRAAARPQRCSSLISASLPRQPVRRIEKAAKQHRPRLAVNAAGDIALSGPSGHADSVRVPESGLLKSTWLKSQYDAEIFGLAIPALGSIMLDPLLSLVDTGEYQCAALFQVVAAAHIACQVF